MKKKFFNLLANILNIFSYIFSFKCTECNCNMKFIKGDKFYSYYKCPNCGHQKFVENNLNIIAHG